MTPARSLFARRAAVVTAAVVSALGIGVVVASSSSVAVVDEVAVRMPRPVGDLVSVYDVRDVEQEVVDAAARIAAATGGNSTVARTGSLGMREIRRDSTVVHGPPAPYLVPMVYTSVPANPIGRIYGFDIAALLGPGRVVMHEDTASVTGAQVGDVIVMQSASGSPVELDIAGIASRAEIGSAELVFTYDVAVSLGATDDTRVIIHDFDRTLIDDAIAAEGLEERRDTRVLRSWDAPSPDGVLSMIDIKLAIGEPWYRFDSSYTGVSMHPDWLAANGLDRWDPEPLYNDTIRIETRCNFAVEADFSAALAEVVEAGLADEINWRNSNTYGGCYNWARFTRTSGEIGFLSRHSYGIAFDTNTDTNCFGCVPEMHCEVVRIFRRNGFAWGGNFRRPDGMHFEWVGERRDQVDYPSKYCPNIIEASLDAAPSAGSPEAGDDLGLSILTIGGEDHVHEHSEAGADDQH